MGIYNSTPALPSTSKQDGPIPNVPVSQRYSAAEWNNLVTNVQNLIAAVQGLAQSDVGAGNFFGLAQNGSPPASAAGLVKLFTDGAVLRAVSNGDPAKRQINPFAFNVRDYLNGVDPSNSANATATTAALNACLSDANTNHQVTHSSGGVSPSTVPTVWVPSGVYFINGPLGSTVNLRGEGAIIVQLDGTKRIFDLTGIGGNRVFTIEGFVLIGGVAQFWKNSNTVNCANLQIDRVFCINPVNGGTIFGGPNTDRGLTTFGPNCFFWTADTDSSVMNYAGADEVHFQNPTVIPGGSATDGAAFVVGDGSSGPLMVIDQIFAAPQVAGARWILSKGGNVYCRRCRFGGEQPMIIYKTTAGGLCIFEKCAAYSQGYHNFEFFSVPIYTDIDITDGDGLGVYLDASIPAAQKRSLGTSGYWRVRGMDVRGLENSPGGGSMIPVDAGSDPYMLAQALHACEVEEGDEIQAADYMLAILAYDSTGTLGTSFGWAGGGTDITTTPGTNIYGSANVLETGTASDGTVFFAWANAFTSLPDGVYTAVFDFQISHPTLLQIQAGDKIRTVLRHPGSKRGLRFPFVIQSGVTSSHQLQIATASGLPTGHTFTLEKIRIFKGSKNPLGIRQQVVSATLPVTGHYGAGDRVIKPAPAAGASPGWVCTQAGAVAKAAWATSTNYTVGDQVTQLGGGAIYRARNSGTSLGSGGGPGGRSPFVDNNITWDFIDVANAVFKAEANLAA